MKLLYILDNSEVKLHQISALHRCFIYKYFELVLYEVFQDREHLILENELVRRVHRNKYLRNIFEFYSKKQRFHRIERYLTQ